MLLKVINVRGMVHSLSKRSVRYDGNTLPIHALGNGNSWPLVELKKTTFPTRDD